MQPKPHIIRHWKIGEKRIKAAGQHAADTMKYLAILPDREKSKCHKRYQFLSYGQP